MNVSGNFNTTDREIDVVSKILSKESIKFIEVVKNENADDGDILVKLENGKNILIEVKEERYERFSKYGDLGIDFISVFYFKKTAREWKGSPKNPRLLNTFLKDIDTQMHLKYGKIYYSKSDLWLFFIEHNGELEYYFFDGKKLVSDEFRSYLETNCLFAVNNKPSWQMSWTDPHNSAVFFINHKNPFLQRYLIKITDFLKQ